MAAYSFQDEINGRAWRETLEAVRLDTPVRVGIAIGIPLIVGTTVYFITGQIGWSSFLTVALLSAMAVAVFQWKKSIVPALLVREKQAVMDAENLRRSQTESARRRNLIAKLANLYIASHDGISGKLLAGLELPPLNWLNDNLAQQGEAWRVAEVQGDRYSTVESEPAPPPTPIQYIVYKSGGTPFWLTALLCVAVALIGFIGTAVISVNCRDGNITCPMFFTKLWPDGSKENQDSAIGLPGSTNPADRGSMNLPSESGGNESGTAQRGGPQDAREVIGADSDTIGTNRSRARQSDIPDQRKSN